MCYIFISKFQGFSIEFGNYFNRTYFIDDDEKRTVKCCAVFWRNIYNLFI